ncbi:MAG: ABC transporter permease [Desulfobacterales bacterium]|nr:ABC transporter permease [Desulfobacterales bacterium]
MIEELAFIGQIAVKSSIAVLLATLGEIIAERSGVLNLGVEGMMLTGALAGAAVGVATGNPVAATVAAALAGGLLALVHGFFSISLRVNQVLSGLALTILGLGLTSFLGRPLIGTRPGVRLAPWPIPGLAEIPLIGDIFFRQSVLAYLAYILVPLCWVLLYRTRTGLKIRAAGEDAAAVDAAGINVFRLRYLCTLAGGLGAGLAGAYLSLAYTPGWKESMTGGQGWVAIAMVIFAGWNPLKAVIGAFLFGGLTALQFYFQAIGIELIPAYILRMLPYVLTIAVMVLVNTGGGRRRGASPAALGVAFNREG